MKRRNFLQLAAASGLTLGLPFAGSQLAQAQANPDLFWVFVTAGGAWDPRFHFDPSLDPMQNRLYTTVGTVGNISYAELPTDLSMYGFEMGAEQYVRTNKQFLDRYGSRLLVLNGVDTSTNNHDTGKRVVMSGSFAPNFPSLAAVIAGSVAADKPMAFLSGGGYDATAGIVPLTRVNRADSLKKLVSPNKMDVNNTDNQDYYHTAETYDRIVAAHRRRLDRQLAAQRLPRLSLARQELLAARQTEGILDALQIPELVDIPYNLGQLERFAQQSQLAIAAFKSGVGVTASLTIGGFDTHGNHDRDQPEQIMKLWGGLFYLMTELETQGIADRTMVVVGSDFGRGPFYNGTGGGSGKDHWPITSMLMMGPGVPGNRVIGATTDDQKPRNVNPDTLQVDDGGVKLTPQLIHQTLRARAGIADSPVSSQYQLTTQQVLPIFS